MRDIISWRGGGMKEEEANGMEKVAYDEG